MNRARLWILGAALGSFAAGMNVGLLVPKVLASGTDVPAPESEYVRDLAAKYALTSDQERRIRLVLQGGRNEEINVLSSTEATQLPPPIHNRLLAVRSRTEQRIRAVLDDEQRARYDVDSRPSNGTPSSSGPVDRR